jgi:glycosyltransferase involved in cell wall biosynthesis
LLKFLWIIWREKRIWSKALFVQAVSPAERANLIKLPGMASVVTIPNGSILPEDAGLVPRDIWLFIGRLAIEQKGLDLLVESYASCVHAGIELPHLVLAGPDFRGGRSFLEELIAAHGVENRVTIRGPVVGTEKGELLRRASLFLHTSRWEGLPLSILEALAHSIPCLLTEGTNISAEVEAAGAGISCKTGTKEVSEAMRLASDLDKSTMGRAAREFISDNYSWHRITERLLAEYTRSSS